MTRSFHSGLIFCRRALASGLLRKAGAIDMSLNLSAIAVRERAVTLFFVLLLAAAGAYAFVMLGRAEDPSFTIKTLTVTTVWPGATAREMQDLVAEPLEKRLQELTWYDRVETTTRPG